MTVTVKQDIWPGDQERKFSLCCWRADAGRAVERFNRGTATRLRLPRRSIAEEEFIERMIKGLLAPNAGVSFQPRAAAAA